MSMISRDSRRVLKDHASCDSVRLPLLGEVFYVPAVFFAASMAIGAVAFMLVLAAWPAFFVSSDIGWLLLAVGVLATPWTFAPLLALILLDL